ncbi:hypothetical protein FJ251_02700 [bacterium]|nr:hypothetical protein [bacterium]
MRLPHNPPPRSILLPQATLLAILAVASFLPEARLWGIDHLAYYPPWLRAATLVGIALLMHPRASRALSAAWNRMVSFSAARPLAGRAIVPLGALAATLLFWSLRSSTLLLGDGQFQAALLRELVSSPDTTLLSTLQYGLRASLAPLTTVLAYAAGKGAQLLGLDDAILGWQALHALLGGLLIALLLAEARRAAAAGHEGGSIQISTALTGALVLFCGYVETYTAMLLCAAVYAVSAAKAIRGGGSPWPALGAVLLAIGMHLQALLLLPSAVILFAATRMRLSPRGLRWAQAAVGAASLAALAALYSASPSSKHLLGLQGGESEYGLLSAAHGADVANQLLLVLPWAPVLMCASLMLHRRAGTADSPAGPALNGADVAAWRRLGSFTGSLALPCLLFLLLFRPALGMTRDWDLFALPALGLAAPALAWLRRRAAEPASRETLGRVTAASLGLAAGIVLPWIGVNAHAERSVQRYERSLAYDEMGAGYCYELLSMHHRRRGDLQGEIAALRSAYAASPNPRYLVSEALAQMDSGNLESALEAFARAQAQPPGGDLARHFYLQALSRQRDPEALIAACRAAARRHPGDPFLSYALGEALAARGDHTEARAALEAALALSPPPDLRAAIEAALRR